MLVSEYMSLYVGMYICMYVCMYVCMYGYVNMCSVCISACMCLSVSGFMASVC